MIGGRVDRSTMARQGSENMRQARTHLKQPTAKRSRPGAEEGESGVGGRQSATRAIKASERKRRQTVHGSSPFDSTHQAAKKPRQGRSRLIRKPLVPSQKTGGGEMQ